MIDKSDLDYLENRLFLQTNLDQKLQSFVMKLYNKYKFIYDLAPEVNEIKFNMRYCKVLLENKKSEPIASETIISATEETKHGYYFYRKRLLINIHEALKNELAATD